MVTIMGPQFNPSLVRYMYQNQFDCVWYNLSLLFNCLSSYNLIANWEYHLMSRQMFVLLPPSSHSYGET